MAVHRARCSAAFSGSSRGYRWCSRRRLPNLDIPNEDARSVDLEDSNLFALNRFPGYDRWEDASRITYGLDWSLERKNLSIDSTIGQSYRFDRLTEFSRKAQGLTGEFQISSEEPGSATAGSSTSPTAIRIDKNNFAVRRNEVDLTVGTTQTYAQIGYLRLDRNIDATIEDLRDKEELRVAARILFHRYWSIFGASVIDLTDRREDLLSARGRLAAGAQPSRHPI